MVTPVHPWPGCSCGTCRVTHPRQCTCPACWASFVRKQKQEKEDNANAREEEFRKLHEYNRNLRAASASWDRHVAEYNRLPMGDGFYCLSFATGFVCKDIANEDNQ